MNIFKRYIKKIFLRLKRKKVEEYIRRPVTFNDPCWEFDKEALRNDCKKIFGFDYTKK